MEINHSKINKRRILDLMSCIENRTGKCFHETEGTDFEKKCIDALDGKVNRSSIINALSKRVDELEVVNFEVKK